MTSALTLNDRQAVCPNYWSHVLQWHLNTYMHKKNLENICYHSATASWHIHSQLVPEPWTTIEKRWMHDLQSKPVVHRQILQSSCIKTKRNGDVPLFIILHSAVTGRWYQIQDLDYIWRWMIDRIGYRHTTTASNPGIPPLNDGHRVAFSPYFS